MKLTWYRLIAVNFRNAVITILYSLYELHYKIRGDRRPLKKEEEEDVHGQVVVITGANRGIGKQIALEFAERGAIVVFGCRNIESAQESINEIRRKTKNHKLYAFPIDLADMDSVERFSETVGAKYPKIKILVNNAGVSGIDYCDPNMLTKDGFNPVMASNHFGHFLLTNLLLRNLKKSTNPRVIVLSSGFQEMHFLDLQDLTMQESGFGPANGFSYANSKLCNSLFAKELAQRMKREGSDLSVYNVCLGFVRPGMLSESSPYYPVAKFCSWIGYGFTCKEAVSVFIMSVTLSNKLQGSGSMYHLNQPWNLYSKKMEEQGFGEKLWEISAQLVKLEDRLKRL